MYSEELRALRRGVSPVGDTPILLRSRRGAYRFARAGVSRSSGRSAGYCIGNGAVARVGGGSWFYDYCAQDVYR